MLAAGFDTTVKSETTIPEPSEEEKAIMNMISGALMPAYLEEAGYEVTRSEVGWEQSEDYKGFQQRRANIQSSINRINNELSAAKPSTMFGGQPTQMEMQQRMQSQNQLNVLNNQLTSLNDEETAAREDYDPKVDFTTRKLDSPEVEYERTKLKQQGLSDETIEKMGRDETSTYGAAKKKYEGEKIDKYKQQQEVHNLFMEKTKRYLEGDFSITDEQKALIQENMAPVKAAVTSMFDKEYSETQKMFDDYVKQVKETNLSVSQALEATGTRIMKTGEEMETALKGTIDVHRELLKRGIEDYTGEVTKKIAINAASLGRSPDDPEYTRDISEMIGKQVQTGELNLAAMEAQGMVGIKERTGAGLEDIERGKVGLAEMTGGKLEAATRGRGEAVTDIARRRGAADVSLEEQAANLRWQVGAGMPPSQVGLGMGVSQYNEAISQQRLQNAYQAMNAPMGQISYYQRERMAQPTTTQTTSGGWGGMLLGGILGAGSMGAQAYTGMAQADALRGLAQSPYWNPYG